MRWMALAIIALGLGCGKHEFTSAEISQSFQRFSALFSATLKQQDEHFKIGGGTVDYSSSAPSLVTLQPTGDPGIPYRGVMELRLERNSIGVEKKRAWADLHLEFNWRDGHWQAPTITGKGFDTDSKPMGLTDWERSRINDAYNATPQ